jgi:hypothetical protein
VGSTRQRGRGGGAYHFGKKPPGGLWADSSAGLNRFPGALLPFSLFFSNFFSVFFAIFAKQFQIGFKQLFEICKLIPSVC